MTWRLKERGRAGVPPPPKSERARNSRQSRGPQYATDVNGNTPPDRALAVERQYRRERRQAVRVSTGLKTAAAVRRDNFAVLQRPRRYELIYAGGPRLFTELIEELRRRWPAAAGDIERRVERFANVDPTLLQALGADRLPSPIRVIGDAP